MVERLLRKINKSNQKAFKKILERTQLTLEELKTGLSEIENVLYQRPLTYVFNDANEPEPLKPTHFLLVVSNIKYPYHVAELF